MLVIYNNALFSFFSALINPQIFFFLVHGIFSYIRPSRMSVIWLSVDSLRRRNGLWLTPLDFMRKRFASCTSMPPMGAVDNV